MAMLKIISGLFIYDVLDSCPGSCSGLYEQYPDFEMGFVR
jgi:hypothetical protein